MRLFAFPESKVKEGFATFLFFDDIYDLTDELIVSDPVTVTVGSMIYILVHFLLIKLIVVDFLTDKGQFSFLKGNAVFNFYRC